ncbi:MAG: hypothetical protein HUK21_00270 [Fibrobacteraceae bacterium]|nr:hypothetical protein [Fibrobacteraceae bacterium]
MKKILNVDELQKSRWPQIFQDIFEDNLVSAFTHGDCLMEGFSALQNSWNISFILKEATPTFLKKLKDKVPEAKRENIQFLHFFCLDEISELQKTFPLEFLHISKKNLVLCGSQPFKDFVPDPSALQQECRRKLQGIALTLRQNFLYTKEKKIASTQELLPILYGLYFLNHGSYPQNNQTVLAPCTKKLNSIEGVLELVDLLLTSDPQ